MARELSQEALLDFLCQAGGRVSNAALLSHFKGFIRDPDATPRQLQSRRELFKGFVNSVAAVRHDPDGTSYVVLKRRYRDLLGEEGLQRPHEPPAAAGPEWGAEPGAPRGARPEGRQSERRRRRRQKQRGEEPAGAAAPAAADAGCNGLPAPGSRQAASGSGERRGSSGPGAREPATSAAANSEGAKCAVEEAQGRRCWECLQNGLGGGPGEPQLPALRSPAAWEEKPERAAPEPEPQPEPGERGARRRRPEHESAASPSPPANVVEAAESGAPAPALPSPPAFPEDPPELVTPESLPHCTVEQLQRTREWVARQVPQAREQGPTRAWSVLPDNFPRQPSQLAFCTLQAEAAPPGPTFPSQFLPPVVLQPGPGRVAVFRSIRSQLSLEDLEDFVEQESHGSEESSSGPKESPGGSEEGLQVVQGTPLRDPAGGFSPKDPQGLRDRGISNSSPRVSTGAKGLAGHTQEPSPGPAPKLRRSFRRSLRAGRARLSSSEDEHCEEDLVRKNRRPPRSRKSSRAGVVPSPRVDTALACRPADTRAGLTEQEGLHPLRVPARERPTALHAHRSEHKSSLVPLEAREHEWIVKLASGAWIRVLTLFWEDPQLALHRDFLTGYTALHWMAKHGDTVALQDLVSMARKAGVVLDMNVKSSCGYTPLHLAVIHGHHEVIKLLVVRLASRINIRDSSGKKPWQYLTKNTPGEIWQLLGGPRGKPIFPVHPLVRNSSPTRKVKNREVSRKASLAALLKSHHNKWKSANEKFPALREREEYSD